MATHYSGCKGGAKDMMTGCNEWELNSRLGVIGLRLREGNSSFHNIPETVILCDEFKDICDDFRVINNTNY